MPKGGVSKKGKQPSQVRKESKYKVHPPERKRTRSMSRETVASKQTEEIQNEPKNKRLSDSVVEHPRDGVSGTNIIDPCFQNVWRKGFENEIQNKVAHVESKIVDPKSASQKPQC